MGRGAGTQESGVPEGEGLMAAIANKAQIKMVKIGPIVFEVETHEELLAEERDGKRQALNGHILFDDCKIKVRAGLPSQRRYQVLWHEIVHGLLALGGMHEHDEQVVEVLANGIVMVLQDNPALVDGEV